MAIEQTRIHVVPKPWGSTDLRPWNAHHDADAAIGELWYERAGADGPCPALLLKLIFTSERLSIQVHPDDAFARSLGLPHGKCEAWYILSATAGAEIALGLKQALTPAQLRSSIRDGSIVERVQWRAVQPGEAAFVPSGTIHAVGAGLVIAEIQQRSDSTFRLFDYGRRRELHVDSAVAAASADQSEHQVPQRRLSAVRTLLVASRHFVLERLELPPGSVWELDATGETWLFILAGRARAGPIDARSGNAVFLEAERPRIAVAADGLGCLIAYVGPDPIVDLLRSLDGAGESAPTRGREGTHPDSKAMPVILTGPAEVAL